MKQYILLKNVIRGDIPRIVKWLKNDEVIENWFGRYTYGEPAHLGYEPEKMLEANEDQWNEVFHDPHHEPHRSIFSIYLGNTHLGEAQLSIDESLGDAQISILIGDPKNWHKGYGTQTAMALLEHIFVHLNLHRAWVDIPEYNEKAFKMFEILGFSHEGTLRKSRPHKGSRHNSFIMGMLLEEYNEKFSDTDIKSHVIEWDTYI
jgi:RimJ/RimL family protein N-acetyltransferase